MKYLKRILMLPFAIVLWTVAYSIKWVRYGGELTVNTKEAIKPQDFFKLLNDVNNGLKRFSNVKDSERLDWLEDSLEESTSEFINSYSNYYSSFKENDDISLRDFIDHLILKK